jgi:protein-S-isoprenylcysteine O-methyltransferase Ste14
MDSVRYFLALIVAITLPPLFLYWLIIHPFVNFWRGKGIGLTCGVTLSIIVAGMVGLFSVRHFLLASDFGTSYTLIGLGLLCLVFSGIMRYALQEQLTIKTLLGLPEIAPDQYPRQLITQGIYGRMRHPRYGQFLIALVGYALIANYLASYLVTALWFPGIYVIVLLEERELRAHFGAAYDEYCRKVPRFLPRPWNVLKER